jgi:butyryl-CoA dehydrogenase
MKSFKNKVCVITGGGSGIGRALAKQLAEAGAKVAISDVNEKNLKETEVLLGLASDHIHTQVLDVSNRDDFEAYAIRLKDYFGGVDMIVNNAGVALAETVEKTSYEDFEWLMDINFWGVVYGTKAFLPLLKSSPEASLVNISSIFGLAGIPTQGAYNASKFAVRGFTEALRLELKNTSVQPLSVHPGGIKTNIVRNGRMRWSISGGADKSAMERDFDKFTFTTPEQAAEVILTAVKKKKNRVLIGADAHVYDWATRLLPRSYHHLIDTVIRPKLP